MNIINETNYNLVKLNYVLFNKFDQRVFYKVIKMEKLNDYITKMVTDMGFIHSTGKVEKSECFSKFECNELNSSTHFSPTVNNSDKKVKYQLFFNLKIDEDEIKDHVKISSSMEFKWLVSSSDQTVTETTNISQKDKLLPFYSDKLFFVIIYPNNQIPALVRVYDSDEFDLLNIDDKNAIFNSYLENVNVEKSTQTKITEEPVNNVSMLKMEDDENIQKHLKVLSKESFDPETGVYHNDELNLTVDENNDLIIDGVNLTKDARDFDFDLLEDRDESCAEFEYFEQLKEMIYEIFSFDEPLHFNKWRKINDTFIFKLFGTCTFWIVAKSKYAIITDWHYHCSTDNDKLGFSRTILVNLQEEEELTSVVEGIIPHKMFFEVNKHFNGFGFSEVKKPFNCFGYDLNMANYVSEIKNPICEIDRMNKLVCGQLTNTPRDYHEFDDMIYILDIANGETIINKTLFTDLITGEDDEGKYVLVRGVFGNLMKYHYQK